jgi:hypothetical protein
MKTMKAATALMIAFLFGMSISISLNSADTKSSSGKPQMGGQGQQKKELTEEDAKQMIKDLNDLKKLQQELQKKVMEFRQKYGMMPDLGGMGPGGMGGQGGMGQGGMGPGGQGGKGSKSPDDGGDFPPPSF